MLLSAGNYNTLPQESGVYFFIGRDRSILYIGKAKNLKRRVSSYFSRSTLLDSKTKKLVSQIDTIRYIAVASEFEALLLEAHLIKQYTPKYNVISKDDKHYIYIQITKEEFPRIVLSRKYQGEGYYFGPFPSAASVKEILRLIRTIIPYCQQSKFSKKSCFYTHIGLCNPCPADIKQFPDGEFFIQKAIYRNNIRQIRNLLAGESKKVQRYLHTQMQVYSNQQDFETAAMFKDKLKKLNYLLQDYVPPDNYIHNHHMYKQSLIQAQEQLLAILQPYYPSLSQIRHIECYDISNISGKFATGSMVTFKNGKPEKSLYRRFQIRTKTTPDDFAMLGEVMVRRLKHTEWKLPDLIVIDGGKPQLIAMGNVFREKNISIPYIGLAKREEEIVVCAGVTFIKITLTKRSSALHLVQRIRDEAHRFAHTYHEHLRLKNLLGKV